MNLVSLFPEQALRFYQPTISTSHVPVPLYSSRVPAGFPSPANDYIEAHLDLHSFLVPHPAATFFVRAKGDSIRPGGIESGDMLIVDKSIQARHNDIVVAYVSGDWTVKRLYSQQGVHKLVADTPDFPTITITGNLDLVIWGVVRHVIHTPKRSCTL